MNPATPAVLLVSPGILQWTDLDFGLPHLVSIGGVLRQETGVRVEILDLQYEGADHEHIARTIDNLGPHLAFGLSCYSSFDYPRVMAFARYLRSRWPGVPIVSGGYHASALPGDLLFEGSPVDAVIVGEAERPMVEIVKGLLGGGKLERALWGPDVVPDLDALPPYAWDLLDRYWPRALSLGRKLQVYLSRGCVYHCTFCMERAKSGYAWRAYSPERAVDELRRLARFTDLSQWVVNLADPLFGFHRDWRRKVLQGILENGLLPRQYWTLTRSDDLDDEDVSLLARARFSIGIGLESGSPEMLLRMQKGNRPEAYLAAARRLAALSRKHGLNWAANLIVGHPGETRESMRETHAFAEELFLSAEDTCGWVSVDPFRLYPGADVHVARPDWERRTGAVFHHPEWWRSWYDGPFRAQHLEPSSTLSYEERVRFHFDAYGPLVARVQERFRGQGRSVDRVFRRSLDEQIRGLSPERRDEMLVKGERSKADLARDPEGARAGKGLGIGVSYPIGLQVRDPGVRRREFAVRALLDRGVLRTESLIEALLKVRPEDFLSPEAVAALLADRAAEPEAEGLPSPTLGLSAISMGLEALEPATGDAIADLWAASGYVPALLAELVGPTGKVLAVHPGSRARADRVRASLSACPNVEVRAIETGGVADPGGPWDCIWIGAAIPRFPHRLRDCLADPEGRAVTFLGPRFRPQDLVSLTRRGDLLEERRVARIHVPVLGGPGGWLPWPGRPDRGDAPALRFDRRLGPALAFHVLRHLDLGADSASIYDDTLPDRPWIAPLRAAWEQAPGRLTLHALALACTDPGDLLARLRLRVPKALSDDPGRRLAAAFADAIDEEAAELAVTHAENEERERIRGEVLLAEIGDTLTTLRDRLWEPQGRAAPPLVILDVPALGRHARAMGDDRARLVATSLAEPADHVLMQVLHEEMHPITDPIALSGHAALERDTRVGAPGYAVHAELEQLAVRATEAFLEARAPEWMPAFRRWTGRTLAPIRVTGSPPLP